MRYYTIKPPDTLKDFVRCFWVLESDEQGYIHRSMAEVCPEMIFHYSGQFDELTADGKKELSVIAAIQGQGDIVRRFSINRSFGIFGVYFYPYAIPLLGKTCAAEMNNQMVDLRAFLGMAGTDLEEQMMMAPCNETRVKIITRFLEPRLLPHTPGSRSIHKAISHIIESEGQLRIEKIAHLFSLSERQFERKFKTWTGFTPKYFSRIVRFHATMKHYGNRERSLTEIAYACGYYDQSHFIHEFKQFSGHHPKAYFFGEAEGNVWRN
jgi:AraC-like DNA-binding protein